MRSAFFVLFLCVSVCSAATITWTGSGSNELFENPQNWSPAQVPGPQDSVVLLSAVVALSTNNTVASVSITGGEVRLSGQNGKQILTTNNLFVTVDSSGSPTISLLTIDVTTLLNCTQAQNSFGAVILNQGATISTPTTTSTAYVQCQFTSSFAPAGTVSLSSQKVYVNPVAGLADTAFGNVNLALYWPQNFGGGSVFIQSGSLTLYATTTIQYFTFQQSPGNLIISGTVSLGAGNIATSNLVIPDGNTLSLVALSSALSGNIVLSSGTIHIPGLGSVGVNSITVKGTGVVSATGLNTGAFHVNSFTMGDGGTANGIELAIQSSFQAYGTFHCGGCYTIISFGASASMSSATIEGSGAFETTSAITFNGTNVIQPTCVKIGSVAFTLLPHASLIAPSCGFPGPQTSTGSAPPPAASSSGGAHGSSSGDGGGGGGGGGNGAGSVAPTAFVAALLLASCALLL